MRYKQNLRVVDGKVFSYQTHVANIVGNELHQIGHWSRTTQKHINYIAEEYCLVLIK